MFKGRASKRWTLASLAYCLPAAVPARRSSHLVVRFPAPTGHGAEIVVLKVVRCSKSS